MKRKKIFVQNKKIFVQNKKCKKIFNYMHDQKYSKNILKLWLTIYEWVYLIISHCFLILKKLKIFSHNKNIIFKKKGVNIMKNVASVRS